MLPGAQTSNEVTMICFGLHYERGIIGEGFILTAQINGGPEYQVNHNDMGLDEFSRSLDKIRRQLDKLEREAERASRR